MNETSTPGFDETKEIFVDQKTIPLLSQEGDGVLSENQMRQIDTAIAAAKTKLAEPKPIDLQAAVEGEGDDFQLSFSKQTLHNQMRYGGASQLDTSLRMLQMANPGEKFRYFEKPALKPEQVQEATGVAEQFTTLNPAQIDVFFQSLDPGKLEQVRRAVEHSLFVKELIGKVMAAGKPQEIIAALKENLLRYRELSEEKRGLAGGDVRDVVSRILSESKLEYPFPRRDFGSGPKAINDSDGRKNYNT